MDKYAPRQWLPHEKPSLPGSPSTPLHSPAKRLAFGVVGLLVAITGGLGNALEPLVGGVFVHGADCTLRPYRRQAGCHRHPLVLEPVVNLWQPACRR